MIFLTIGISLFFLIRSSSGNESDNELDSTNLVELNSCCNLSLDFNRTLRKCGGLKNVFANTSEIPTVEFPSHLMTNNVGSHFRLRNMGLDCQNGRKSYVTPFKEVPVEPIFEFQPDGYMKLGNRTHSEYFDRNQYCVNGLNDSNLEVVACQGSCSSQTPCIRKCCPLDSYVVNSTTERCKAYAPDVIKWGATVFENPHDENTEMDIKSRPDILPWYLLHSATGWEKHCGDRRLRLNYEDPLSQKAVGNNLRYRVRQDGRIFYWEPRRRTWMELIADNYCIDGSFINDTKDSMTQVMLTCQVDLHKDRSASAYFGVLCIITSIFSILTVIVYILLWEKQTIHGWTIMSYALSISFFFIFVGIAFLTRTMTSLRNSIMCKMIATLAHFFFISTFSWLTMISFDLWVTFRFITISKGKGMKRFLRYSVIGWGIPLIIVCFSWIMEVMYKDDEYSEVIVPKYGVRICYLTPYAYGKYIYAPGGILMAINLTFFAMTTWNLYKFKYFNMTTTQMDCKSYVLFVKLFLVVGVLWSLEIISWVGDASERKWYWKILDVLNSLTPVALFLIFVCKYDVLNALGGKYPVMKPIFRPIMRILAKYEGRQIEEGSAVLNLSPIAERPNSTQQFKDDHEVATEQ